MREREDANPDYHPPHVRRKSPSRHRRPDAREDTIDDRRRDATPGSTTACRSAGPRRGPGRSGAATVEVRAKYDKIALMRMLRRPSLASAVVAVDPKSRRASSSSAVQKSTADVRRSGLPRWGRTMVGRGFDLASRGKARIRRWPRGVAAPRWRWLRESGATCSAIDAQEFHVDGHRRGHVRILDGVSSGVAQSRRTHWAEPDHRRQGANDRLMP